MGFVHSPEPTQNVKTFSSDIILKIILYFNTNILSNYAPLTFILFMVRCFLYKIYYFLLYILG